MRELLGDEAEELERSLERVPGIGLRVNTLKLSPAEFDLISPWPLEPVPWCPSGYQLPAGSRPGLHPFHSAGLYYLQEPSAMAAAEALSPRPGEHVLDLAAAPGGKSTHLAAMLDDEGLIVANDVNAARARELSRNMERWGSRISLVTSSEPYELARIWGPVFDAVLLDAPCSGEGMFRKTPRAVEQWTPELVRGCAVRQKELLGSAARLVKPGGRLVYSTCTFEPLEDELIVAGFLDAHHGWDLLPTGLVGVDRGRPDWGGRFARRGELSSCTRVWPHRSPGEGHFVALLKRAPGTRDEGFTPGQWRRRTSRHKSSEAELRQAVGSWREFAEENLRHDPFMEYEKILRNDGLYAVPPGTPPTDGLRVMRPGVWLGTAERGRFVPSHALALALRSAEVVQTVELDAEDVRLASYLLGAELEVPGSDGWLLVLVAGYPIGWGRRARGIVKNHYPKGLRRAAVAVE